MTEIVAPAVSPVMIADANDAAEPVGADVAMFVVVSAPAVPPMTIDAVKMSPPDEAVICVTDPEAVI